MAAPKRGRPKKAVAAAPPVSSVESSPPAAPDKGTVRTDVQPAAYIIHPSGTIECFHVDPGEDFTTVYAECVAAVLGQFDEDSLAECARRFRPDVAIVQGKLGARVGAPGQGSTRFVALSMLTTRGLKPNPYNFYADALLRGANHYGVVAAMRLSDADPLLPKGRTFTAQHALDLAG